MKTTLVRIYAIDWEKLKIIKSKHGFPNYAETVGYVLQKFPEMILDDKSIEPKPAIKIYGEAMTLKARTPIIDAEKAQKDFIQLGGEKL